MNARSGEWSGATVLPVKLTTCGIRRADLWQLNVEASIPNMRCSFANEILD